MIYDVLRTGAALQKLKLMANDIRWGTNCAKCLTGGTKSAAEINRAGCEIQLRSVMSPQTQEEGPGYLKIHRQLSLP